jgi:uncharacterized protein YkwD
MMIAAPATVAVLAVVATQTGAAAACGRWLFGEDENARAELATRPVAAAPADNSAKPAEAAGAGGTAVITVRDGAQLGHVGRRFVPKARIKIITKGSGDGAAASAKLGATGAPKPTTAQPSSRGSKRSATTSTKPASTKPIPEPPRATPQTAKPTSAPVGTEVSEVVRLTNNARAAQGCPALKVNSALTRAAQGFSDDMAADNYFPENHTTLDGRDMEDRIRAAGYSYSGIAENIAAGQRTAASVVGGWLSSPGHRRNMLNCAYTEIGVGVARGGSYGIYWTQDFGTPR